MMIQFNTTPTAQDRDPTPVLQQDIDDMRAQLIEQGIYTEG